MKKVLILLLLFIVACGGSSEETVVEDTATTTAQDTTTTTIPPAPTVDFNIVEIYNTKLVSELCSDATEIDTTSEECLRQYRDNLETVFSFDKSLYTYITELNTYLESYPSAMTEEYTVLFEFLNNQYRDVPETYGLVLDKYFERFGGVPELVNFSISEDLSVGCPAEFNYSYTENLKSGSLTFINNSNEKIVLNIKNGQTSSILNMINSGGEFTFLEGSVNNYEDKEFQIYLDDTFSVSTSSFRFVKFEFDKTNIKYGEDFSLTIQYVNSKNLSIMEDENESYNVSITLRGLEGDYTETIAWSYDGLNNKDQYGGYIDLKNNIITVKSKFFDSSTREDNTINFYTLANPYYIENVSLYAVKANSRVNMDVNKPGSSFNPQYPDEPFELFGEINSWGTYEDIRSDCSILQWKVNVPIFYNNSLTFEK